MSFFKKLAAVLAVALMGASLTVAPQPRIEVQAAPQALSSFTRSYMYDTYYYVSTTTYYSLASTRIMAIDLNMSGDEELYPFVAGSNSYSSVRFYNSSNTQVGVINFLTLDPVTLGMTAKAYFDRVWVIDLNFYNIPLTAVSFKVWLFQGTPGTPSLTTLNTSTDDNNPSNLNRIDFYYYEGGGVYTSNYFYEQPYNVATPTRTGYTFLGWTTFDGKPYGFTIFDTQYIVNGVVKLYGTWGKVYTITFMNGLTVYDTDSFTYQDDPFYYPDKPTPDPTRSGYTFTGWKTRDQEFYNFDRLPTISEFNPSNDTVFYLYASFVINSPSGNPYSPNTPSAITKLAELLTNYGMYNFPALMFIYFVVIIVVNGLIAFYAKASALVHFIISIGITIIFAFMNLIPVYALIPIGLLLIVGTVASLNGNPLGGTNE